MGEGGTRWYRRCAATPASLVRGIVARSRSAARPRDRRRCGSRSAPRSRACRRSRARSRAATWRSSRSTCRGSRAAADSRGRASAARRRACVASSAFSSSRNESGTFAVNPASACAIAKRAVGFGRTSFASSRQWTPSNCVSNFDQRVTQWMSCTFDGARQLVELLPRELELVLDLAEDAERPGREVVVARDRAGVQHGPLLGQVLPRRQPRRVVARVAHLLLRFRPEHAV